MKATQLSAWFLLACIMSNTVTAMYTSPILKKKLDLHKPLGGVSFLSVDEHNDVQQIQADSLNDLEIQPETAGAPMPSLDVQQQALALLKQQLASRSAGPALKATPEPEQHAPSFLQFENRESDDVTIMPEGDARAPPAEIQQKALELLRQRQAELTTETPRLKSLARATAKEQPATPVVGPVTVSAVATPVPVHVAAPESSNPGTVTLSLPEDALKEVMAAREGIAGPQLTDKPNANPLNVESTVSVESPRPAPAAQYKANDKYPVLGGSAQGVNQFVGRPLTNYPLPSTAANGPVPFYNQPAYNNAPQIVPNQPMNQQMNQQMNQPMNQPMNQQPNQEPRFSRQSPMSNVGPAQMGYAPQLANMQMPMTQDMNMGQDNFNYGYAPMQNGDSQYQQLAMNPYVNRNYEAEVADSVPVGQTSFGPSSMEDPNLYRFKGRLQNRQTTNNMNTMGMVQRQMAQQQHMNQQLNQYMNLGVRNVYSMDKSPSVPVRNVYHNEPVSLPSTYGQQQQQRQMAPANSPRFASREAPVSSVEAQAGMPQDMSSMSQSAPVMEFNPESMNQNNMGNNMQTYQQPEMAPMDTRNMNAVDMQPPMMGSQYDQYGGIEAAGMPMMS
eukprot:GILK01000574.1.p1 GENE.GILK01000574.1~~GILK01000574.1.p1  ORF type:complete len:629 (-),score=155.67 GILK01000574.1:1006-2847(-)